MLQLRVGRKPPGRLVTAGCALLFMLLLSFLSRPADAYVRYDKGSGRAAPALNDLCLKAHDVNAVYLMISNQGPIGINLETSNGAGFFPSNTPNNYVFGTGLWFGAKYDADGNGSLDKVFTQGYNPLAGDSEFREGNNDQDPGDPLACLFDSTEPSDLANWPEVFHEVLSTKVDTVIFEDPRTSKMDTAYYTVPATYGDPFVRSDQDLVTQYTTKGKQPVFGSFQMPLQVNQRSMAFKTGLAGQAIFFILDVTNWGDQVLTDAWAGYDNDMDVGVSFSDDLTSFIVNRITPEGDTIRVNMAYAWDSDFTESNFTGDPGFVGIAYLRSPGNPFDGIDNDGDGLVDESTSNGIDDDGDGVVDDPFEVDELGLVNYSKHCNPPVPCQVIDPQTDEEGYDLLSCNTEGSATTCLEGTQPADIRFMMSSGPFDWLPGQTQQIVLAMVFANAVGHPSSLDFVGYPPRPDPNDPALGELLQVKDVVQGIFDLDFPQATPPPAPNMTLIPGDGKVTILWNDLPVRTPDPNYEEFVQIDPSYRQYDFEGFRVWRSRTGDFSRLGDPDDPDWPLTPEAIQQNEDLPGLDLELLAQYDLADGIKTDSLGVTCSDSVITQTGDVVYTKCDTFNLGTDTGLRFSYVDTGVPGDPLINGMRYYYCVTSYDYNSDALPLSRLSLDSGVSFPQENSVIPQRRTDALEVDSDILHVDETGNVLDDTSSVFSDSHTGELDPADVVHASNSLVDFSFSSFYPESLTSAYNTIVFDSLVGIGEMTSRIYYHLEDEAGQNIYIGTTSSFDLPYDGEDHTFGITAFDTNTMSQVQYSADLTFNVDASAFVSDLTSSLFGENASGVDITDSLGNVGTPAAAFLPAGYRASDIRMEWVEAGTDTLTLQVHDLDNLVDVPFGDGIVDSTSHVNEEEEGSNWAFLPVGGGALQPGGRYFLTSAPTPIADLWICGSRVTVSGMSRMPQVGDVWTLRQVAMTTEVEIDSTLMDTTTTYLDARRPPVPDTRYRLDFSPARDLIPPEFTIGIFQNTILTNDLDVYVVASEALSDTPALTIAGDSLLLSKMESNEVEIYSADYRLGQAGTDTVEVRGSDTWGNEGEGSEVFSVGMMLRSMGGTLVSPDRVLRLTVPPDAIREELRYYLCMVEGDVGGGLDQSTQGISLPEIRTHLGLSQAAYRKAVGNGSRRYQREIMDTQPRVGVAAKSPERIGEAGARATVVQSRMSGDGERLIQRQEKVQSAEMMEENRGRGGGASLSSDIGEAVSAVYALSPPGEQLFKGAELSFDLDALDLGDTDRNGIGIFVWTGDGWTELPVSINHTTKRITTTVDVLGCYQLRSKGTAGSAPLPRAFGLAQNFPNPFNPSTTIGFDIPEAVNNVGTELTIYNIRGQRVRTLLNENKAPGSYSIQWDGRDDHGRRLASGIYLYRLKAGDFVSTRKMVLLK